MEKFLLSIFLLFSLFSFAQPTNDDCDFATNLVPSLDIACIASTQGTVFQATASTQTNACAYGSGDDDDVWFKFAASSTTHKINLTNIVGSSSDMYFSVYQNPCSALGTQILCSDNNSSSVVNLTIGNDYFIRVFTKTSSPGQTTTFDICITTPPVIPSNDECLNAIPMFVNQSATCDSLRFGTINGATTSTQTNSCSGTVFQDVWYSFTATQTAHYITLTPLNESPINYYHAAYQGTCGSIGTPLKCSDPNSSTVTGLVVGQSYFIRVYTTSSILDGIVCEFSLCVSNPPLPPINDECVNAINLAVNDDFLCGVSTSGTVLNALQSNQPYTCSDNNYIVADDDVWFKFTATRTTHSLYVSNLAGDSPPINYVVYSGNCTSVNTPILCNSSISPESSLMNNLIIGNDYLVRVFSSDDNSYHNTTFSLCIGSEPRPVNDECNGATSITVNPNNACTSVSANVQYATLSSDVTSCTTTDLADVWFKFTALDTSHVINLSGQYSNSTDALEYDVYAGTCANLSPAILCNVNYANQLNNLTIGNEYYIKLHGAVNLNTSNTSLCVKTVNNRPINDECYGATLIV